MKTKRFSALLLTFVQLTGSFLPARASSIHPAPIAAPAFQSMTIEAFAARALWAEHSGARLISARLRRDAIARVPEDHWRRWSLFDPWKEERRRMHAPASDASRRSTISGFYPYSPINKIDSSHFLTALPFLNVSLL
jgi:hypothetical protein